MNAERRKAIQKAADNLRSAVAELEQVRDDEQEAFDNLPESFQQGDKGETMQSAIQALEDAIEGATDAADRAEEAME